MSAAANIPRFRPSHRDMRWQERALCRDAPLGIFFAGRGNGHERAAVAICLRCPVREQCLIHALTLPEDYGVWGAATEAQRRKLRRIARKTRAA